MYSTFESTVEYVLLPFLNLTEQFTMRKPNWMFHLIWRTDEKFHILTGHLDCRWSLGHYYVSLNYCWNTFAKAGLNITEENTIPYISCRRCVSGVGFQYRVYSI